MDDGMRPWDRSEEVPTTDYELTLWKLIKLAKFVSLCIITVLVFGLAVCSKTSFLLLVTLSSNSTQHTVPVDQKPVVLLSLGCVLVGPSVLLLLKSLWKALFKTSKLPQKGTLALVLGIEFLVSLGSAVLTIVAMPFLDIVTNVMLLNSIALSSSVLQMVVKRYTRAKIKQSLLSALAFFLILVGYALLLTVYLLGGRRSDVGLYAGLAVAGTVLISLNWWESYADVLSANCRSDFLQRLSDDRKRAENVLNMLSSLLRVLVTGAVLGSYVTLSGRDWASVRNVPVGVLSIVGVLVGVQLVSSALCHWFAVAACKMQAMRRSFVLPVYLASLAVLAVVLGPVAYNVQQEQGGSAGSVNFTQYCAMYNSTQGPEDSWFQSIVKDITQTLCDVNADQIMNASLLTGAAIACWLGFLLSTAHTWSAKLQRIQRTQDLFFKRRYEGAFLEQSLLLNTHFDDQQPSRTTGNKPVDPVTVYLCATMWHETYDEMTKILISMFRLDKCRPKKNAMYTDMTFEAHIYFDDAFEGVTERHLNQYAQDLVKVIRNVYSIFFVDGEGFFNEKICKPDQRAITTPYGGRLVVSLPCGNTLMVHFKDKNLIRHKKRWSQVMYMHYISDWRLQSKYSRSYEENMVDKDKLEEEIKKEQENTYILTLDGDTDFQPASVLLLIDRLRTYPRVGAVCGRIHPTGSGPMVWYQKFEYAVSHWLQKTAEHVFGSVLCSPGCFSLFRATAILDDNVMKRYTTKATEARHHVQYDQGEDRWLSTLLLQQGWKVEYNAASDAYTNVPDGFKEFYNQRRRWDPSTMANIIDLLGSSKMVSRRNPSISLFYLIYQMFSMAAGILVPSTICITIAGILELCTIPSNAALCMAVIPPAIYALLCFKLKSDTQIIISAFMSVGYAFLMLLSVLLMIGGIVQTGRIWTPSSLFLISISTIYLITALIHPKECHLVAYGLLYLLCIPSAYLLLSIYTIVNMNNVSWGTRETVPVAGATKDARPTPGFWSRRAIQQFLLRARFCAAPCCRGGRGLTVSLEDLVPEDMGPQNTFVEDVKSSVEEQTDPHQPHDWVSQLKALSNNDKGDALLSVNLDKDEKQFWEELIQKYLEPLIEDKDKQKIMANELRSFRNKASFAYFFANALWIAVTVMLRMMSDNTIFLSIPKLNYRLQPTGETVTINPIGFMSMICFVLLVVIQFFAMVYHRVTTVIHLVAYVDTEAKDKKLYGRQDTHPEDDGDKDKTPYQSLTPDGETLV